MMRDPRFPESASAEAMKMKIIHAMAGSQRQAQVRVINTHGFKDRWRSLGQRFRGRPLRAKNGERCENLTEEVS